MMNKQSMLYMFLLFSPLFLFGLYVISILIYGSITEYKPEETISIKIKNQNNIPLEKNEVNLLSWNIGYSGLGNKADFFLDDGKMIRSPKSDVKRYFKHIKNYLKSQKEMDFILLQEVDTESKRSYKINQLQEINTILSDYSHAFAENFKVKYVPAPLTSTTPLGKVNSGLLTYSKYHVSESKRYQFPGEYEWPKNIFHLDRCFLTSRIKLENQKELIVINSHHSAYDEGKLKSLEMEYLKKFLLKEYSKGNYVIVGSDWNQCPPGFEYRHFSKNSVEDYYQSNIDKNFLPTDWQWIFDERTPTNRKLSSPYKKGETFTTIIDFYLISPNVKSLNVETIDMDFEYSDHQPVQLKVELL